MAKKKPKRPLMSQRYIHVKVSVELVKLNAGWHKDLAAKKAPAALRKAIAKTIEEGEVRMIAMGMNSDGHDLAQHYTVEFACEGTYTVRN